MNWLFRMSTAHGLRLKLGAGKIHALRPVFRELGVVSAFVYEAIERADGELISADIARISGLSPKP